MRVATRIYAGIVINLYAATRIYAEIIVNFCVVTRGGSRIAATGDSLYYLKIITDYNYHFLSNNFFYLFRQKLINKTNVDVGRDRHLRMATEILKSQPKSRLKN